MCFKVFQNIIKKKKDVAVPLLNVLLCDWLRRDPPGTEHASSRQTVEVELTTHRRVWPAGVRHVVAVERHHVTGDVTAGGGVWYGEWAEFTFYNIYIFRLSIFEPQYHKIKQISLVSSN